MAAAVISLDDGQVIELINVAKRRLFFAYPGMSVPVANTISNRWNEMGPDAVQIILDADPKSAGSDTGRSRPFACCTKLRAGLEVQYFTGQESEYAF
jgi:hypothetical protein